MITQTVFKSGNSQVISIPKHFGFKVGDEVTVHQSSSNRIFIDKTDTTTKKATPAKKEFNKWLKQALTEDEEILKELALR